jgi:hypothetical protein
MRKILEKLRMRKNDNLLKGFTLAETLVYIGLLSIFFVIMTEIFGAVLDVRGESTTSSSVEQDGRYILTRLTYDIQRASSVSVPAANGTTSSSLTLVIGGINYAYSVSNGVFQLVNDTGTNSLNTSATTVSNFSVQRIGNTTGKPTLQLSFTVLSVDLRNGTREQKTFQTTASLR